jgi:hypothetical protein
LFTVGFRFERIEMQVKAKGAGARSEFASIHSSTDCHRGQAEDENASFPGSALDIDFAAMDSGQWPSPDSTQAGTTGCPALVTSKETVENLRQIFSADADTRIFNGKC